MSETTEILVLGIETSCDETAAAVVVRSAEGRGQLLSNVVRSQWEQHRPYGGVVPELASRAHVECLDEIIAEAMTTAGVGFGDLDAIAVTAGPGLIGGVMVGVMTAEAIAAVYGTPLVAVNHLEAHALTVGLTEGLAPPYLLLLVSGGHTQLLLVEDVGRYRRLGTTIDDALGEAFDKTAKLMGLGYPGGPEVERWARKGDGARFKLPRPMMGREEPHFSFAGLKTAVRVQAQALAPLRDQDIADLCAAFERAVADSVGDRVAKAMRSVGAELDMWGQAASSFPSGQPLSSGHCPPSLTLPHKGGGNRRPSRALVVAGGVAANAQLKASLQAVAAAEGYTLHVPPAALCTDNGAMIAWAGAERFVRGMIDAPGIVARARWPLDASAVGVLGKGRLGAKA